ncbi:hypothetical protein NCCP28_11090 [Niallia sp. NCCP-28]|nr:hypothetical protein NCCP28_11090 [Niallia sp. NCCP-28]
MGSCPPPKGKREIEADRNLLIKSLIGVSLEYMVRYVWIRAKKQLELVYEMIKRMVCYERKKGYRG